MVLYVFLLEIALIAVLGVGIGVALGIVFAYKVYLVYFADIIVFSIPWDRLLLIVGVASIAAIASTAQPAIRASRIPPRRRCATSSERARRRRASVSPRPAQDAFPWVPSVPY